MSIFTLTIRLGNEAMMDAGDVATELRDIARDLEYGLSDDWVRDGNGNCVGEWRLESDAELEAEAERQESEDACPLCGAAPVRLPPRRRDGGARMIENALLFMLVAGLLCMALAAIGGDW